MDYGVKCDKVPPWCDNESAIKIVEDPVQHSKTKHIEIRHHFTRDCYVLSLRWFSLKRKG